MIKIDNVNKPQTESLLIMIAKQLNLLEKKIVKLHPQMRCPNCGGTKLTPIPKYWAPADIEDSKGRQYLCTDCHQHRLKGNRPKIVCLCGSTRFTNQMLIKQWELTKQGNIVLSWCALPDTYFKGEKKTHIGEQEGVKEIVDDVHKRKIDLADEVFIINVDDYIGESTRSEINYAEKLGKPISYLEK